MDPGAMGVWTRMDGLSIPEAIELAQRVEELGHDTLWIPDAFGRDPFAHAALVERIRRHRDAGATHVCIQPLDVDDVSRPSLTTLERLAPGRGA